MKTKEVKMGTWLPVFPGFYGTWFGDEDGSRDTEELARMFEDAGLNDNEACAIAERCVGNSKLYDTDYRVWMLEAAQVITAAVWSAVLRNGITVLSGIRFEKVVSPKYYNFTNDAIDCELTIPDERNARAALLRYIRKNREAFDEYLLRYKSRDGFCSSYSYDAGDWIGDIHQGLECENACHKAGAMLDFVLWNEEYTDEDLWEYVSGNGYPSSMDSAKGPLMDMLNIGSRGPALNALIKSAVTLRAYIKTRRVPDSRAVDAWADEQIKNLRKDLIKEAVAA